MIWTKCQNMLRWSGQNANQKVGTDKMPTTEISPDKMPTFGWHYVRLAFCPVGILSAHRNIHQLIAKTIIYLTCTLQPWKVNTANLAPLWNWGKFDWIELWLGLWSLDTLKIMMVTWYLLCATISVPKISAWPERSSTTTLSVFPQSTCSW